MLLQIQDGATALTLRGGMQKMAAEGRLTLYYYVFDKHVMCPCIDLSWLCRNNQGLLQG